MAAKEEPIAGVQSPAPPVRQADTVKGEVQAAAPTPSTPLPSPPVVAAAADASPSPNTASPKDQITYHDFGRGLYPKPQATHEAVLADESLFMQTFYNFHTTLKSKPTIPKMGGKDLDVHLLYREVSSRGGLQAVIRDRKWKEITLVFQLPRTTTSASYVLRKYYITLLFHYEMVYRNGAVGPLLSPPATLSGSSPTVQPGDSALSEGAEPVARKRVRKRRVIQPQIPAVDPAEAIGATITGSIEGKLDFGYLVTMVVGGEKLKGVLYHVPPGHRGPQYATLPGLLNSMNADLASPSGETQTRRKRRRKEEMPKKDPNAPRPNRTGYNFFFAEQRQRLKALHPEKDREISRMIGEAWNGLSEEDKTPYQERGLKDKERFKKEFRDYREKQKSGFFDNPSNGQGLADQTVASPRDPVVPEHPPQPDHSATKAVDPLPAAAKLSSVPKQAASGPSEQLSTEQKPAPLVPAQ